MSIGLLQLPNGQIRLTTSSAVSASYDTLVLGDRPVAYISGQTTAPADTSGYGHQVNAYNSPTLAAAAMPNGDNALIFNGSTQYIEIANTVDLSVPNTGVLTIEAWMRPDTLNFANAEGTPVSQGGQGAYVHWMGKGETNAQEYVARIYNLADSSRPNRISGYCFNNSGGLGIGSYFQDSITAGEWIHYALIINTNNTSANYPYGYTKVFKNGQQRDQDSLYNQSLLSSPYYISPQAGNAPFRIATRDFSSWFQGAIAKIAVYSYELSPAQLWTHYANMMPPTVGEARHVGQIGVAESYISGQNSLTISITSAIPIGSTLVARIAQSYTSSAPTITDTRGNVWTVQKTSKDGALTVRGSIATCAVTTALQAGDSITVTYPSGTTARQVAVDEFAIVKTPTVVDASNTAAYTTSTQLGTNIAVTTTQAYCLLVGMVLCTGDNTIAYTEDPAYTSLSRVGAYGVPFTTNGGFRAVATIGTYNYEPSINTVSDAIEILVAFQGI